MATLVRKSELNIPGVFAMTGMTIRLNPPTCGAAPAANAGVVTAKLATLAEIARTRPRETESLFIVTSFPSGISAVVKLIDPFRAARAAPKPKRLLGNGSKRQGLYVRGC